ncbi:MAG: hypothetical protein ACLQVL_01350 [Terriglobia bacterium]
MPVNVPIADGGNPSLSGEEESEDKAGVFAAMRQTGLEPPNLSVFFKVTTPAVRDKTDGVS